MTNVGGATVGGCCCAYLVTALLGLKIKRATHTTQVIWGRDDKPLSPDKFCTMPLPVLNVQFLNTSTGSSKKLEFPEIFEAGQQEAGGDVAGSARRNILDIVGGQQE